MKIEIKLNIIMNLWIFKTFMLNRYKHWNRNSTLWSLRW